MHPLEQAYFFFLNPAYVKARCIRATLIFLLCCIFISLYALKGKSRSLVYRTDADHANTVLLVIWGTIFFVVCAVYIYCLFPKYRIIINKEKIQFSGFFHFPIFHMGTPRCIYWRDIEKISLYEKFDEKSQPPFERRDNLCLIFSFVAEVSKPFTLQFLYKKLAIYLPEKHSLAFLECITVFYAPREITVQELKSK